MRSEGNDSVVDCEDPMTVIACTTDTDACPAKCRESDEPTIVKAGDLAVTAKATEGRRAIVPGVSDLDTLTFKTSEDVSITKVMLERYGYSSANDVAEVRLEDADGNVIAEPKGLSKDKVTLSIKKDYRNVDGTYTATVVARLTGSNAGGTIGFKVIDADSSAKNLNLDDYTPYTYEMVSYSGATVTVDIRLRIPAIIHPIMHLDLLKPYLSKTERNTELVHGSVRITGSHKSDLCLTIAMLIV